MPYKTGDWGEQGRLRSKTRLEYFKKYQRLHPKPPRFRSFGSFGEKIGLKLFPNSKLVRKRFYDIVWQDKKIEVKISALKNGRWNFHTERQKGKTDYFLLICMKEDSKTILKIYFIPDNCIPNSKQLYLPLECDEFRKFILEGGVKTGG